MAGRPVRANAVAVVVAAVVAAGPVGKPGPVARRLVRARQPMPPRRRKVAVRRRPSGRLATGRMAVTAVAATAMGAASTVGVRMAIATRATARMVAAIPSTRRCRP